MIVAFIVDREAGEVLTRAEGNAGFWEPVNREGGMVSGEGFIKRDR